MDYDIKSLLNSKMLTRTYLQFLTCSKISTFSKSYPGLLLFWAFQAQCNHQSSPRNPSSTNCNMGMGVKKTKSTGITRPCILRVTSRGHRTFSSLSTNYSQLPEHQLIFDLQFLIANVLNFGTIRSLFRNAIMTRPRHLSGPKLSILALTWKNLYPRI